MSTPRIEVIIHDDDDRSRGLDDVIVEGAINAVNSAGSAAYDAIHSSSTEDNSKDSGASWESSVS